MAAGIIFTVLSNIPWGKVVANAPKVTIAAMKLWDVVANRKKQPSDESEQIKASPDTFLSESDLLNARVLALEDDIKYLQDQMEASSELIKALAEQNAQLVQRIELNRINLIRYSIAAALGGAILLGVNIYLLI